jgi:ribosomal protein L7/L12
MTNDSSHSVNLPQAAVEAIWKGNAIEAINIVRVERDIGLEEAKDQVDAYVRHHPALQHRLQAAQAQATQTLVRWLVGVLMLAGAAAYFFISGM